MGETEGNDVFSSLLSLPPSYVYMESSAKWRREKTKWDYTNKGNGRWEGTKD